MYSDVDVVDEGLFQHESRQLKKKNKGKKKKTKAAKGAGKIMSSAMRNVIELGPRPFFLVDKMEDSFLKTRLQSCAMNRREYYRSDFSIGHRGACMQFPEHTEASYKAAQIQGAGINECDVTFTKDLQLICRHAQCDLHTTTDVVLHPEMNAKCTTPFVGDGSSPRCCASDFTLEEIKTLCAKMDSSGSKTGTPEEYVYGGTAAWRTDLYQYGCERVPTHKESIELIGSMGGKFTPELKSPQVDMPFGDYTQEMYAQHLADEYKEYGIPPSMVWLQSFNHDDVAYWVKNTNYGSQAVALDGKYTTDPEVYQPTLDNIVALGGNIVAPPMWMLVAHDESAELGIVESDYSKYAKSVGLNIITWTLERTGPGKVGWYWQTLADLEKTDGTMYALLYVLAFHVKILGIFSDWPATPTFFANCMNLKIRYD